MAKGSVLDFTLLPISRIKRSVGDPAAEPTGSAYDPVFRALEKNRGFAVKIDAEDSTPLRELTHEDRRRIQAGLKTMANNRGVQIETRLDGEGVCVWLQGED